MNCKDKLEISKQAKVLGVKIPPATFPPLRPLAPLTGRTRRGGQGGGVIHYTSAPLVRPLHPSKRQRVLQCNANKAAACLSWEHSAAAVSPKVAFAKTGQQGVQPR
jgi:ribosomal protein L32E